MKDYIKASDRVLSKRAAKREMLNVYKAIMFDWLEMLGAEIRMAKSSIDYEKMVLEEMDLLDCLAGKINAWEFLTSKYKLRSAR